MATALTGIFNNGVAGMLAFSQAMGTISDNISNQNTVGYKRVETTFSTLLGRQEAAVQGDDFAPHLIARNTSGVRANTRQAVDVQGSILTTGRQYDVAINGGGMFIFGNNETAPTEFYYGRAGQFDAVIPVTIPDAGAVVPGTSAFLANTNGQYLMAMPITGGVIPTTQPTSVAELVAVQASDQADFAGQPTATATLAAVIPATGATTVSTPINYIDGAGDPQGLTLEFSNPVVVPGTSTTWDMTVYDSTGAIVGATLAGAFVFDSAGRLPAGSSLTITAGGTTFTVDMEQVAMLGDATISGGNQAVQISYEQDGLPAGAFEGLSISENGVIYGRYTGGATQALYRIPVATFGNPNALQALAGNVYQITEGSGEATFELLGGEFARLNLQAVETANVDLADQFSQMIVTQRAYSSAAQVVSTADEMSIVARDLI